MMARTIETVNMTEDVSSTSSTYTQSIVVITKNDLLQLRDRHRALKPDQVRTALKNASPKKTPHRDWTNKAQNHA